MVFLNKKSKIIFSIKDSLNLWNFLHELQRLVQIDLRFAIDNCWQEISKKMHAKILKITLPKHLLNSLACIHQTKRHSIFNNSY